MPIVGKREGQNARVADRANHRAFDVDGFQSLRPNMVDDSSSSRSHAPKPGQRFCQFRFGFVARLKFPMRANNRGFVIGKTRVARPFAALAGYHGGVGNARFTRIVGYSVEVLATFHHLVNCFFVAHCPIPSLDYAPISLILSRKNARHFRPGSCREIIWTCPDCLVPPGIRRTT